jgi:hypothetical protein
MSASTFTELQALAGLRYRIARLGLARAQKKLRDAKTRHQTLDREAVEIDARLDAPLVTDASHKPTEARAGVRRRLRNLQTRVHGQQVESAAQQAEFETSLQKAAALAVRREVRYSEFQELVRKDSREAERAAERRREANGS